MVNRIWQFRMGDGMVRTPNDFGTMGDKPESHALLDWLAAEFVAAKWSVKAIDRLIVTSAAYRQSSAPDAAKAKIDPQNRLLWRMNRKRFDAEMIRDAALSVAGTLNPKIGGRPVRIPIEPEVYDLIFTESERDGLWPVSPDKNVQNRRGIYLFNKRSVRLPLLTAFDQPDTITSCPVRPVSTHAAAGPDAVQLGLHAGSLAGLRRAAGKILRRRPHLPDRPAPGSSRCRAGRARRRPVSPASSSSPAARCRISVWPSSTATSSSMSPESVTYAPR